jgi:hypothetical protein
LVIRAVEGISDGAANKGCFDTIPNAQLQHDIGHVMLDGLLGEFELDGDFFVR